MEVHDTGIEPSGADIGHDLFSPYVQTKFERRQGGNLTGLRLAIVTQLVNLQQGRLRVNSEQKRGSAFWFELKYQLRPRPPCLLRATLRGHPVPFPRQAQRLTAPRRISAHLWPPRKMSAGQPWRHPATPPTNRPPDRQYSQAVPQRCLGCPSNRPNPSAPYPRRRQDSLTRCLMPRMLRQLATRSRRPKTARWFLAFWSEAGGKAAYRRHKWVEPQPQLTNPANATLARRRGCEGLRAQPSAVYILECTGNASSG